MVAPKWLSFSQVIRVPSCKSIHLFFEISSQPCCFEKEHQIFSSTLSFLVWTNLENIIFAQAAKMLQNAAILKKKNKRLLRYIYNVIKLQMCNRFPTLHFWNNEQMTVFCWVRVSNFISVNSFRKFELGVGVRISWECRIFCEGSGKDKTLIIYHWNRCVLCSEWYVYALLAYLQRKYILMASVLLGKYLVFRFKWWFS